MQSKSKHWKNVIVGGYILLYAIMKAWSSISWFGFFDAEWINQWLGFGYSGKLYLIGSGIEYVSGVICAVMCLTAFVCRVPGKIIRWTGIVQLWLFVLSDILKGKPYTLLMPFRLLLPCFLIIAGNIWYKYLINERKEDLPPRFFPFISEWKKATKTRF